MYFVKLSTGYFLAMHLLKEHFKFSSRLFGFGFAFGIANVYVDV